MVLFAGLGMVAIAQPADVIAHDPDASTIHGTKVRASASQYPFHIALKDGRAAVGAEFMGHTIEGQQTTFVADDYIVVEVAIYPAKGQTLNVSMGDFQLRVNEKRVLMPQPAQLAATRMKYPDWDNSTQLEAAGGIGGIGAGVGRPPVSQPRFPGAPTDQTRLPRRDPVRSQETVVAKQTAPEAVVYAALPEGPTSAPVSGLLYFEFKGKLKSLKSMELLIRSAVDTPEVLPIH